MSAGKPPAAPERRSSTNAARDSADSFLTGVNLVDALVFADAESEANECPPAKLVTNFKKKTNFKQNLKTD